MNEQRTQDYFNFLMEVLQATADSNGDTKIIYPLLRANLDKLDNNLADILRNWATAKFSEVEADRVTFIANTIWYFSNRLSDFPLGNKENNMEIGIAGYETVLKVFTRESNPENWAAIQNNLANVYSDRIRGYKTENLENAIAAYHLALSVRTKEDFPMDWAITQNNLAAAYRNRIRGDKAENLENAIATYHLALSVRTKEDFPYYWAVTQNNLGEAYSERIRGDKAENLENVIAAYLLALSVCTKEDFPYYWAKTQNNLAIAYRNRIRGYKTENLENAIAAYHLALSVRTKEDFPTDWAKTQNNLGLAYSERIKGDKAENLENAIAAYHLALSVYTKEDLPKDWATTQNNLANAYSNRIRGDKAENLENAIATYHLALSVRTKEDFPMDWAVIQNNLATAYGERIRGDKAENLEDAIATLRLALSVRTKEDFPIDWAVIQNNLGNANLYRIRGDKAENLENAITTYHLALEVYTKEDFPMDWATTQNNLGETYRNRIRGDQVENLENAMACYQAALRVAKPDTLPILCLTTSRNLASLASKQKDYQLAINNYEIAIAAIEQSRDWIPNETARQEILRNYMFVYENMIQACVNAEQYDKALETVERFRCRRLLDLILTKDLYKNGEVPEDILKLEAEMEEKQREIDYLHRQLQTPEDKQEMLGSSRHVTRDLWDDITGEIQKLVREKGEIRQKMLHRLYPVLEEESKPLSVSVEAMKGLLNPPLPPFERGEMEHREMERDDVALLSFYTTRNETYIFILTQTGVKLHRCQEQGYENFQFWLGDNWLTPYSQIDDSAAFQAVANLAKCDIDAIESINPKPSNVIVKLTDGTTTEISFSDFEASRKQQKHKLYKQWQDKMEGMLKEIADRLQINQLIEKLTDIKEIILVPFMYLHQIPLPALPLDNGEYLGDKFRVRIAPSTQVLTFCRQQPQNPEANLPRYGIVENTRDDLPYTPKECELVAQIYGVAREHHLKGSKEATKAKYKQLLTKEKVLGLLSSHHAKSNLTEPLESKLLLGDTDLTLGELLNASIRFPQLGDLFLSCCETALGNSELTDDIFTLSAAFLSAGASNVISSLWSVNDLATTILSYFYHRNRAQGIPSADALWQAQMELKELTLAKAEESLEDAEAVLEEFEGNHYTVRASCSPEIEENPEAVLEEFAGNHPVRASCSPEIEENPGNTEETPGNTEYEEKKKIADNCQKVYDLVEEAQKLIGGEKPFNHPYYWAGFVCQGEG
ncbi:MAG: tetratricopeptide repeat protein [Okeania sp. SIO3B5]|uniref:CHAT domain-containing protein n=1 Tax=Okeania sp. SIO3B5 TaxID=2607811 RepID=UPI0013FF99BE|nr:CHAT domain-containing protein [Okeania sp. SIO3B5]NEO53292.1 tetratricopeptide repeat protein [Okeania sp. SIO3B5]